jgi:hypothetical protein
MILSVVLLQNCVGLIKDEPDSGSDARVTTLCDETEEGNITVEESLDIKKEHPEAIKFPPIKTEPELRVWGMCVRKQCFMLSRPLTATKKKVQNLSMGVHGTNKKTVKIVTA